MESDILGVIYRLAKRGVKTQTIPIDATIGRSLTFRFDFKSLTATPYTYQLCIPESTINNKTTGALEASTDFERVEKLIVRAIEQDK